MYSTEQETALREIEEVRTALIATVNANADALRDAVLGVENHRPKPSEYEYPLSTTPSSFKGKKPLAVIFGGERVEARTWRKVYAEILHRCNADPQTHDGLMYLRGRVSGRARHIIYDKPDSMDAPIMLSEGLYVESKFDTEWQIRILTRYILDAVRYDYSGISIVIRA